MTNARSSGPGLGESTATATTGHPPEVGGEKRLAVVVEQRLNRRQSTIGGASFQSALDVLLGELGRLAKQLLSATPKVVVDRPPRCAALLQDGITARCARYACAAPV